MIEIQVKTEHFKESSAYYSITCCPLAVACKDYFPEGTRISVGGCTVSIDGKNYMIDDYWGNPNGNGDLRCSDINKMISDAQNGEEIPTVTVVLTEY